MKVKVSGRNTQVARIYALFGILEAAPLGLTVAQLEDRLRERGHTASRRTLYRDLQALEAAGFPLATDDHREDSPGAVWKLERAAGKQEALALTPAEFLALFLARGALGPLKESPFYEDLDRVFQKIETRLGERGRKYFEELSQEIAFDAGPRWGLGVEAELLETVRAACTERHVLEVHYASANSGTERRRELGPHYLYFAKGALYLVAEDLENGEVKVFSLARMRQAAMQPRGYDGAPTDPETLFQGTFGIFRAGPAVKVAIRFSAKVAPFISERRWHESQVISPHSDGSITASFQVALCPELLQWILGFGPHAEALEPLELRAQVREAAAQVSALYPAAVKRP